MLRENNIKILTPKRLEQLFNPIVLVDLDNTLIASTELNNDAYNFALEQNNLHRIETFERITRASFPNISKEKLASIIKLKQKYFTEKWMQYRLQLNNELLEQLKNYDKNNCYIWTSADECRAGKIISAYVLGKYFAGIICDDKNNINNTFENLFTKTNSKNFIVYENDLEYLKEFATDIEELENEDFDVYKFHLKIN